MRDPIRRTLAIVAALHAGRTLSARDIAILCGTKPAAARRLMHAIETGLPGVVRTIRQGRRGEEGAIRMKELTIGPFTAFLAGTLAGETLPDLTKAMRSIFAPPTDLRGAAIVPTPTDPNRPRAT